MTTVVHAVLVAGELYLFGHACDAERYLWARHAEYPATLGAHPVLGPQDTNDLIGLAPPRSVGGPG